MGFYSFGEISPLVKGHESFCHGATLATLLVGQRKRSGVTKDDFEKPQSSKVSPVPIRDSDSDNAQYIKRLKLENKFLKRK